MPILTPYQHETETINPANFLDNGAFPPFAAGDRMSIRIPSSKK